MSFRVPLVVLVGLLYAAPVSAWHKDGHMAIGRIAWQKLDPKQQAWATKILKAHVHNGIDHYKVYLSADRPAAKGNVEISVDEWAFARAAAWPDWVRDPKLETRSLTGAQSYAITKAFHKSPWHFVNLPFAHPADADFYDDAKIAAITKDALVPELDKNKQPRHAIAALKGALKILGDANAADADKAVALCWLLHLVGDLHQPLHASALIARAESLPPAKFDKPVGAFDPPAGDVGGNRWAIRRKGNLKNAEIFHAYWDALVFDDRKDFLEVEAKIQQMLRDKAYQPENLPELKAKVQFLDWAQESLQLAKTVAYRQDGTADSAFLAATPLPTNMSQKEMENALKGLEAPVLSAAYQAAAEKAAERRMVLAGYRIVAQFNTLP